MLSIVFETEPVKIIAVTNIRTSSKVSGEYIVSTQFKLLKRVIRGRGYRIITRIVKRVAVILIVRFT